ncbi:hypothetical protein EYB25_000840 [Talaromyces marneffei]|nr:hypothetical protein EYB25_000840 [Talaromyces marneffei]
MIPLEKRSLQLLHVACRNARVEIALFFWILDRCQQASTPNMVLPCGRSTRLQFSLLRIPSPIYRPVEELVNQLLDRGVSARDMFMSSLDKKHIAETVHSRAISRASHVLVKRLVAEGEDVHTQTMQYISLFSSQQTVEAVQGITPLHLGGLHANLDGIQTLFDLRGDKATVVEIVLSKDSAGSLPLHWAARGGHGPKYDYMIPRDEIVTHVASTIELLLNIVQDTINVQDHQGYNALWYMVYGV